MRSLLSAFVAIGALSAGDAARADPCPPAERPLPLDARDDELFNGAAPPFAALLATAFVQGCGAGCLFQDLHAERCGTLAGEAVEIPSTTASGPLGSQATVALRFEDGLYDAYQNALVPADAALEEGITAAGAYAEFGLRDLLHVSSAGDEDVTLSVRFQMGGLWTNWKCLLGVASRPPVHEVQLWIFDTVAGQKVVDYDVFPSDFADAIDETLVFSARPVTTLQAHLFVNVQAPASTFQVVGDNFCEGGESLADFGTIRLRFENPDPAVTVVSQSGIAYSQTVPEPAGAGIALCALVFLRLRRGGRALPGEPRSHRRRSRSAVWPGRPA